MLKPPPETVTLAETERRILRAIRTLKVVRDPDAAYLRAGSRSSWPAILREWSDLSPAKKLGRPATIGQNTLPSAVRSPRSTRSI
jgi:hypothetical protein